MSTVCILLLLLAQAPLEGTAVDRDGRPLAGVEVILAWGQESDGSASTRASAVTDSRGRYEIAAPGSSKRPSRRYAPVLCSYSPGSGLVAVWTRMERTGGADYRLAFNPAGRRRVTVRGDDGKPLPGVRLTPMSIRVPDTGRDAIIPDALAERMATTIEDDGRAELACLEPTTELRALRARIPGLGTYTLALTEPQSRSEDVELKLKLAGTLAGRVTRSNGEPVAAAEIEVWSQPNPYAPLAPIRFEAEPIRSDREGRFQTPAVVLAGAKYRAFVRAKGLNPILTTWISPGGKPGAEASFPAVVLTPPRSVSGRVSDRQARPVAGATVIAGGQGLSTATDEAGKFRLDGLSSDVALLVVRREGFRIDGRLVDRDAGEITFVLARFDEPATREMRTLPGLLPLEERRKLARRVLEPYLGKILAGRDDSSKLWALRSLMAFDPAGALEALERTTFQRRDDYQSSLRREIALEIARDDPEEAAAVAESIPQGFRRAEALADLAARLPDGQRQAKRRLADRVLAGARAEPEPRLKVWQLGEAGELLLDLGETEKARSIFAEGLPIARQLNPKAIEFLGYFASRLARIDLPSALALLEGPKYAEKPILQLGNVAARIASSQPAEAERLVGQIRGASGSHGVMLRTCQNMAGTDLDRARRIALSLERAEDRAQALIFTAYGVPAAEKPAARELIGQALQLLDPPREGPAPLRNVTSPLMPLVESVDPTLVPELFWRSIAELAGGTDPTVEQAQDDVLRQALFLARYDRQVASALHGPAAALSVSLTPDGQMIPNEVLLLGLLDPHRAVAAVEARPDPPSVDSRANWSRIILSKQLGRADSSMWDDAWRTFSGLGAILGRRDVLH